MRFNTDNLKNAIVYGAVDREIICAFHDIDGTHSLIRNWQPVMSRVLYDASENGLPPDAESEANIARITSLCGIEPLDETDRFCIESAGLSALTQMEWALRRYEENTGGEFAGESNREIIRRIWDGKERWNDISEPAGYTSRLAAQTPVLFRVYEQVLNRFCRDKNLAEARTDPQKYLIPGSREFMRFLHDAGVKNYFITGAVVDKSIQPPAGMYEEVLALGFEIGEGLEVEDIIGSTWEEKIPKDEVMYRLLAELGISGENVLVVGDGRSEISAGVSMGAVTLSRLPENAVRQRELHHALGTNLIVPDYIGLSEQLAE